MGVKKIVTYGSNILRKKTNTVKEINDYIINIANDMIDTMIVAPGVGLAANQVGVDKQIIVVDMRVKSKDEKPLVIINPRIVSMNDEYEAAEEGCLSFPGINADVKRATFIRVQALDVKGDTIELQEEGIIARIFQHEIDHINGVLFIDHFNFIKKQLLRKELKKLEEETRRK